MVERTRSTDTGFVPNEFDPAAIHLATV